VPKKNKSPSSKSQVSATKKLIRDSQKQAKRQLADQWRFLRKIGAYQTKETAAEIRLTDSRVRAIKKKMREIQSQKKLVKGRVVRPIVYGERKTRSGKTIVDYHFSPHFDFIRTKNKPSAIEGVRKVGKGLIVEKTRPNSKIRVTKKGDIVEVIGKQQRTRKRYKGRDLLKLLDEFDNGTYKFKKHDFFVLHKWGSANEVISSSQDGVTLLSQYVETLSKTMDINTFDSFINSSYIEIIKMIDN
jgi:hypothetical protein